MRQPGEVVAAVELVDRVDDENDFGGAGVGGESLEESLAQAVEVLSWFFGWHGFAVGRFTCLCPRLRCRPLDAALVEFAQ